MLLKSRTRDDPHPSNQHDVTGSDIDCGRDMYLVPTRAIEPFQRLVADRRLDTRLIAQSEKGSTLFKGLEGNDEI